MSAEKISYELKRFAGIQRDYKPEEVERLRGSIKIEYSMCKQQSQKLWRLLNTEPYVNTLGSLSGNQAVLSTSRGTKESTYTLDARDRNSGCGFPEVLLQSETFLNRRKSTHPANGDKRNNEVVLHILSIDTAYSYMRPFCTTLCRYFVLCS